LLIPEITLEREGEMERPTNVVFSTNPKVAFDGESRRYYVKGGEDVGIVLGELVGYGLATLLSIPVPEYAVGRYSTSSTPHFASRVVEDAVRDAQPFLEKRRLGNPTVLCKTILLDIWLANIDRNLGNFLVRSKIDAGKISFELVAIDFEKSTTIRSRAPLIDVPNLAPGALWPRNLLGKLCRGYAVLQPSWVAEIQHVAQTQIEAVVVNSFAATGLTDANWRDGIVDILLKRQSDIGKLAKLEWN
jgi:hypothetical protein